MGPNLQKIVRQIYDSVTNAEGLWQMYDKTRFTKSRMTKLPQRLWQSYNKMNDSSLAVVRQHLACMQ